MPSTAQTTPAPEPGGLYGNLARPFLNPDGSPATKSLPGRGNGPALDYISGEQAITRLNECLGVDGWSFAILEHGYSSEADEYWARCRLTIRTYQASSYEATGQIAGGQWIESVREQFGSQRCNRNRSGEPVEVGFDMKGAATDALKKCATMVGVALYLYDQARPDLSADEQAKRPAPQQQQQRQAPTWEGDIPPCAECGVELVEIRFRDGSVWAPSEMASRSKGKHGRVLCMEHYRLANEAQRRRGASAATGTRPAANPPADANRSVEPPLR